MVNSWKPYLVKHSSRHFSAKNRRDEEPDANTEVSESSNAGIESINVVEDSFLAISNRVIIKSRWENTREGREQEVYDSCTEMRWEGYFIWETNRRDLKKKKKSQ